MWSSKGPKAILTALALIWVSPMPGRSQATDKELVVTHHEKSGKAVIGPDPVSVTLEPPEDLRALILEAATSEDRGEQAPKMVLRVGGFKPDRSAWAGGCRVFLNLPDEPCGSGQERPSAQSPHYVGSFSFFPAEGEELNFNLSPTATLKRLAERGELGEARALKVTLVGIPRKASEDKPATGGVRFSEVSLRGTPSGGATPPKP